MERYRLAGGGVVRLRPGTTDAKVFDEIFIERVYARALEAAPCPTRTIADLGANIGLSVIELLRRFPRARAVAVEPDASNVALLKETSARRASRTGAWRFARSRGRRKAAPSWSIRATEFGVCAGARPPRAGSR